VEGYELKRRSAVAVLASWIIPATLGAQSPQPAPGTVLVKGDSVPPVQAQGIDGAAKRVDYPKDSATILLFFLSSCPACHKMIPLWNSAYERRSKDVRVFAVMLDQEPPGFFMATPVLFPVLRAPGATPAERKAFTDAFKIQRVPVTLRVAPGGQVEDVAQGPVDAIRVGELFRPYRVAAGNSPK
jgi:hypothetical protein